jgi:hypothetical protein
MIERRRVQTDEEKDIVTGLITSTDYLKQVYTFCDQKLLTVGYARTVAAWCLEYFHEYQQAPFSDIKAIFEREKEKSLDSDTAQNIESFLENLNDQYEDTTYNVDFQVNKALNYFKGLALDLLMERVRAARLQGHYAEAEALLKQFQKVEKNKSKGVEVWTDTEAIARTIHKSREEIFSFPGAMGQIIRPFRRKDFVAVVGPSKRGKSWLLIEIAFLAAVCGYNVVFYSFEMTEEDILMRLYQRITGLLEPSKDSDRGTIHLPYFGNEYDATGQPGMKTEVRKRLTVEEVEKRLAGIRQVVRESKFKLECAPANSMSVPDVNISLDNMEYYDNFIPDVIVSDYADITAPERQQDKRHQIDETWQGYRAISQKRNCLVVTASHSNKATFDRNVRQGDMAEDYRKLHHVTWAGALNQTEEEIDQGVMRLSVIADRFNRYNPNTEALMTQCFDIGRFYLDSRVVKRED